MNNLKATNLNIEILRQKIDRGFRDIKILRNKLDRERIKLAKTVAKSREYLAEIDK